MNTQKHGMSVINLCIVLLLCLILAPIAYSDNNLPINESADLDFFTLQTTIMEVHAQNNYLIAGEKIIELVDFLKGNKRFRTMVKNSGGDNITLGSLRSGQKIFVRGFELQGGTIQAREIYRLPETIRTRNDLRKYSFFEKVPVWESTIVK